MQVEVSKNLILNTLIFECINLFIPFLCTEKSKLANYYIITTKQERFVRAILERNNISCPPNERLFGLENKIGELVLL
jgi:hypothetical protein